MAAINSAKTLLRQEMKKRIALLSSNQKLNQSKIVAEKALNSHYFKESSRISIYINMNDEIQTRRIIEEIFNLGKICFIPRYSFDKIHMEMVKLHSIGDLESLPMTKWKIKQPNEWDERENALCSGGLELIFVPGLAFTKNGKRLGRGKGFYDTFLKQCFASQTNPPITVGLAFGEQICQDIPTDDHDFKLDWVICSDSKS